MRRLKMLAVDRNESLTTVVNDAIDAGLEPGFPVREPYRQQTYELGAHPGVNLKKALDLASELESEYTIDELELGR